MHGIRCLSMSSPLYLWDIFLPCSNCQSCEATSCALLFSPKRSGAGCPTSAKALLHAQGRCRPDGAQSRDVRRTRSTCRHACSIATDHLSPMNWFKAHGEKWARVLQGSCSCICYLSWTKKKGSCCPYLDWISSSSFAGLQVAIALDWVCLDELWRCSVAVACDVW